jgi:hypothetical protein
MALAREIYSQILVPHNGDYQSRQSSVCWAQRFPLHVKCGHPTHQKWAGRKSGPFHFNRVTVDPQMNADYGPTKLSAPLMRGVALESRGSCVPQLTFAVKESRTGLHLRNHGFSHGARRGGRKLFSSAAQVLDLLPHQGAKFFESLLLRLAMTNASPRKQVRTITHVALVFVIPQNEFKIAIGTFHCDTSRMALRTCFS